MFFKLLKDALKVKNVRNKILFTIFIIFVFRVGTHVTVPGINAESLKQLSDLPFLNMLNLVSGNAMNNFSIFSMGVNRYAMSMPRHFTIVKFMILKHLRQGGFLSPAVRK